MAVNFSKLSVAHKSKLLEIFLIRKKFTDEELEKYTDNQKEALKEVKDLPELKSLLNIPEEDTPVTIKDKLQGCFSLKGKLSKEEVASYMETYIGKNVEPKWIDFLIHNVLLTTEEEFLRNNKRLRFSRSQLRVFYRTISGDYKKEE